MSLPTPLDPQAGLDFWMDYADVLTALSPSAQLQSVTVTVVNATRGDFGVEGDAAFCWVSEAVNGSTLEITFVAAITDGLRTWQVPSTGRLPAATVFGERIAG